MRREPAVLIAAASSSLTQAISTALKALAKARVAISITARPARAGREPFNQSSMAATSKELARVPGPAATACQTKYLVELKGKFVISSAYYFGGRRANGRSRSGLRSLIWIKSGGGVGHSLRAMGVAWESGHGESESATGAGAGHEHRRIHHLLHGVDDVRGAGGADQGAAAAQRDPVRPAGLHAGAHRLAGAPAAGHAHRPLRRAH